jgi:hypothetical protein
MTPTPAIDPEAIDLPLQLKTLGSSTVKATWLDDTVSRELVVTLATPAGIQCLEELFRSCYEAGYADASNPRLFVP